MIPSLTLRSGDQLPVLGLGMWKIPNADCASLVQAAAEVGYRHFDSACDYGNEREVGDGLRAVVDSGLCRREDLWVTSKLWNTFHRSEHIEAACRKTLSDLQVDYLDLYLIHFPIPLRYVAPEQRYPPGWFFDPEAAQPQMEIDRVSIAETWAGMEQLKQSGLVKEIGVCNFNIALLRDMLAYANDPPAVLQVETHPYLTQEKLYQFCQQEQIAYTAFSPLGALSYHEIGMADGSDSLLQIEPIQKIAAAHDRSPAQVLLRWGVQRGTAVIPKTSKPQRLAENFSLFDFALSDTEMATIDRLNRNQRYNDPGVFCQSAFNTFCPIYE